MSKVFTEISRLSEKDCFYVVERQRMLGVFDIGVNTLHRTHIGSLELPADLQPGEYVKLTKNQLLQITNNMFTEN